MQLSLNVSLASHYTSQSQKIRVITESWLAANVFCPCCGATSISRQVNNKPVSDFICKNCGEDFELKSMSGGIPRKVVDGAYKTMMERLNGNNNPSLFILNYDQSNFGVKNLYVVPKHFFIPEIIQERRPLAITARRAGWVGCNILLDQIPNLGKIHLVQNKCQVRSQLVQKIWQETAFLGQQKNLEARRWSLDILSCIDLIKAKEFSLTQLYQFEAVLADRHPKNNFIKDKIRQQLQILRSKGLLHFVRRGFYRLA